MSFADVGFGEKSRLRSLLEHFSAIEDPRDPDYGDRLRNRSSGFVVGRSYGYGPCLRGAHVIEECGLPPVATLDDVVRDAGNYQAGDASHIAKSRKIRRKGNCRRNHVRMKPSRHVGVEIAERNKPRER